MNKKEKNIAQELVNIADYIKYEVLSIERNGDGECEDVNQLLGQVIRFTNDLKKRYYKG
jgi:hypothetical protein